MNKSIAIAGLMAFGAVHTFGQQPAASTTTLDSKIWTVSTSVRGFYDSNYATAPSAYKDESFGYSINPSFGINVPLDQTSLQLSYTYGYKYFEGRPNGKADQSHQISANMLHNFTENTRLSVSESFVVAQEPSIIDANGPVTLYLRTLGDNMRNTAKISLTHDFTEQVGVEVGYSNTFYNYDEENTPNGIGGQNISRSAVLDRMQHLITADMRWYLAPDAIGIVGYQYGIVDFTADQIVGYDFNTGAPMMSDSRDRDSHYAYVGFDKFFNNQLSLSPRAGFQYVDYDNGADSQLSPYADARLAYNYAEGSVASFGVRHQRITTDLDALDQEATTLYGNITHRISSVLAASLFGQYQYSSLNSQLQNTFNPNGGLADRRAWASSEQLYSVGANLTYRLNQYFSTELGYSFDYLNSGVTNAAGDDARSFKRHQVYIGVRATY